MDHEKRIPDHPRHHARIVIRFDEGMNYGEDMKFVQDVQAETDMIEEVPYDAYVWIRRGGSVTTGRKNDQD